MVWYDMILLHYTYRAMLHSLSYYFILYFIVNRQNYEFPVLYCEFCLIISCYINITFPTLLHSPDVLLHRSMCRLGVVSGPRLQSKSGSDPRPRNIL